MPITRPWTWKSGSPCATTSSAVHSQASASASRFEAIDAARQDGALGRAGRARGVDDQRRRLLVGLGRKLSAARGEVDLDARPRGQRLGQLGAGRAQDRLGRGVVEDVAELARARLRVDGHGGDARRAARRRRPRRLGRRHGPHADALGARHLARDVRGRVAHLRVGQLQLAEAQGEAIVGVAQRGEEHVRDPSMHARRRGHRLRRPRGPAASRAPRPRARAERGRGAHPRGERQPHRPGRPLGPGAPADARPAAAVRAGLGPGRRGDSGGQRGERLRARATACWG